MKEESGGVTEAVLFQTDGPVSENGLSPNSFVFTLGVTKARVLNAECNFLVGLYCCIRSGKYGGDLPERKLKQMVEILY